MNFFKTSDSITGSAGPGPETLPLNDEYYAFIEAFIPNNGIDRYAHIKYAKHEKITRFKFWYDRSGINMCRFRLQSKLKMINGKMKLLFLPDNKVMGGNYWKKRFQKIIKG